MAQEGVVPITAHRMYYNCWLAVESLIDFLDIEDDALVNRKGVDADAGCLLERNRSQDT
jgi:hypothetical protein